MGEHCWNISNNSARVGVKYDRNLLLKRPKSYPGHHPDQKNTWMCNFSIPGFNQLDGSLHDQDRSQTYKTEWEARTNAFQRAKLFLEGPQNLPQGHIREKI